MGGSGAEQHERLALLAGGREVSHLAVRYVRPSAAPGAPTPNTASATNAPAAMDAGVTLGEAAAARAPSEPPLCLLYLHGFGSTQSGEKAEFFRQAALAEGLAFCSFDFEGHGSSGGDMRGLTLTRNLANVERVHAFLRERGHEQVCLVGSSMGGGSGLWYAALHPESIVAGLHLAPALDLDRSLLAWAGEERTRSWQETGVLAFHNQFVACELGWELIEDLRRHPTAELAARHSTPALLLQGQLDAEVPWRGAVELAALSRGAVELHLFADGDHRLTDRKQRLWELMLEFLRGRGLLAPRRSP